MRKKGFTLIELLVVISIVAMLLAILMPALGKVKRYAERLVCSTNCRSVATACVVYSNDTVDYSFPVQGGGNPDNYTLAFKTSGWSIPTKDWSEGGTLSVAASLYLLVRYVDVGPKSFVCKSGNERPFDGKNPGVDDNPLALEELWDFGGDDVAIYGQPMEHVSLSFQRPYPRPDMSYNFPATAKDKQERAIVADKSPFYEPELAFSAVDSPDATADSWVDLVALIGWDDGGADMYEGFESWHVKIGNSAAHEREGQNVAYGDCHVTFARRPDVGVRDDNIYVPSGGAKAPYTENQRRQGKKGAGWRSSDVTEATSKHSRDSFLINDGPSRQE